MHTRVLKRCVCVTFAQALDQAVAQAQALADQLSGTASKSNKEVTDALEAASAGLASTAAGYLEVCVFCVNVVHACV